MHYKGHVGCSIGYSLDTYKTDTSPMTLNSEANDQENRRLHRMLTQLTYMNLANFMHFASRFLVFCDLNKYGHFITVNFNQTWQG